MKIFLCRHGKASYDAVSDRMRPLTNSGVAATKTVVSSAHESLRDVSRIWASDLLRAQQTAEIISSQLKVNTEIKHFLRPESSASRLVNKMSSLAPDDGVLLIVSHMPFLGDVVSELCQGHPYDPHPFATSEIVLLEGDLLAAGLCSMKAQFLPD